MSTQPYMGGKQLLVLYSYMGEANDDGEFHFDGVVICQFVFSALPSRINTKRIRDAWVRPLGKFL